jgi:hypothetical protein
MLIVYYIILYIFTKSISYELPLFNIQQLKQSNETHNNKIANRVKSHQQFRCTFNPPAFLDDTHSLYFHEN